MKLSRDNRIFSCSKLNASPVSKKVFLILVVNILFFLLMAQILPIQFEDNDDVIMLLLASGEYTGTPQPNLVFINYIYGYFLIFLYNFNLGIEWYTVVFSLIHIISLTIISWHISEKSIGKVYQILFLLIFYVVETRLILHFQFTTTAALCATAGIVLLSCDKNYTKIAGSSLFIVSSLIRFEVAIMILLIASPFFFEIFIRNSRLTCNKTIIYLIIALTFSFMFKYNDRQMYSSEETWNYYFKYNKLRGQINDNPNAGTIVNSLPKGISRTDYYLLLSFFPDGQIMDLKKIESLSNILMRVNFKIKIQNIYPSFRRYTVLLSLVLIAWGIIFIFSRKLYNRMTLFFTLCIFIFLLSYISLDGNLKYRVFLSALFPLIFVMYSSFEGLNKGFVSYILIFALSSFIIVFSLRTYNIRASNYSWRNSQFSQQVLSVDRYLSTASNRLVPFSSSFSIEYFPPFGISKVYKEDGVYFSGWMTNNPLNYGRFYSFLDLVNRHSIFLSRRDYDECRSLSWIKESILINYGKKVHSKVELCSEDYVIVKLYTIPDSISTPTLK